MLWDYTDSLNYCIAEAKVMTSAKGNDFYPSVARIHVSRVRDGKPAGSISQEVLFQYTRNSLRLSREKGVLCLFGGDGKRIAVPDSLISGDWQPGAKIIFREKTGRKTVNSSNLRIKYLLPREFPDKKTFPDPTAILSYLKESRDSIEGVWGYLDRNIDGERHKLGGFYTLATVRNGDHYDILYLGGAKEFPELWEPMMKKGVLKTTIFSNHFDLQWIHSDRHSPEASEDASSQEQYASIDQNSILTLNFPLYNAQIRFRRLPLR